MASYPNWDIDIEDLLTPEQLSATALWVFSVILPILTAFGLAGNCFNLAVLTLVNRPPSATNVPVSQPCTFLHARMMGRRNSRGPSSCT